MSLVFEKIGKLRPLVIVGHDKRRRPYWLCKCDCGNYKKAREDHLKANKIRSCGCLKKEQSHIENLTGRRFGRLIVVKLAGQDKKWRALWECKCDCGGMIIVRAYCLKGGSTQSCGCLQRESRKTNNLKHGKTGAREYNSWQRMISRCYRLSNNRYYRYGGRGIKVCDRWLDSRRGFENFFADMGTLPAPGYSIERVDNDGDYCPENCTWATAKEQARNRKTNRLIEYEGRVQCIAAWAEEMGVDQVYLRRLLLYHDWSLGEVGKQRGLAPGRANPVGRIC